jgi:hypothetical protein
MKCQACQAEIPPASERDQFHQHCYDQVAAGWDQFDRERLLFAAVAITKSIVARDVTIDADSS